MTTTTDTLHVELNPAIPSTAAPAAAVPGPVSPAVEKPRSTKPDARCHYRYPNGRRCVVPGLPDKSGLCLRHHNRQVAAGLPLGPLPNDFEDLSAELLPKDTRFSSSEDLRDFLTRLLFLMTEGAISPRRASVLAYVTTPAHSRRRREGSGPAADLHLRPPAPQTRLESGQP